MQESGSRTNHASPWPHRLAVALVCVVFPLIWVGGLVTTYDAGMAVPDWPGTYGRNLLLYPWTTWLAGPWDLFIEHGHRLLGATAGLIAIALVVAAFATRQTKIVRWLSVGALVLVIAQGALGGARVLFNARQMALIHGCVGPAFFAYCACLAAVTSKHWKADVKRIQRIDPSYARSAFVAVLLAYGQLVLGAHLRHPTDSGSPHTFQYLLLFHVVVAVALVGHVAAMAWRSLSQLGLDVRARFLSTSVLALISTQIGLGISTLIVKYGWPAWLGGNLLSPEFTVTAKGFWSSMIVTAHVANGSLILAVLAVLGLHCVKSSGLGASLRDLPTYSLLGVTA